MGRTLLSCNVFYYLLSYAVAQIAVSWNELKHETWHNNWK